MVDSEKQLFNGDGGRGGGGLISDFKNLFSVLKTRRTTVFAYGFMFAFVIFTAIVAFNPSANFTSPWFNNFFSTSSSTISDSSSTPSIVSYIFPNSSQPTLQTNPNSTRSVNTSNSTAIVTPPPTNPTKLNLTVTVVPSPPPPTPLPQKSPSVDKNKVSNFSSSLLKNTNNTSSNGIKAVNITKEITKNKVKGSLMNCNIYDGNWVKDDSYPLYEPGSCPHIDESFNCHLNGRLDKDYDRMRWQPKDCDIPRLKGKDMLELLRDKRLVFVGDSLNRNMWESLVCILRNSVPDKTKVFEASGKREFRTEGAYAFIFKDYNCKIEFVRSPFLVQEWEMPDTNGTKKETLRLDVVEKSSSIYKDADVIVFNTGHWWTHDKTSKGKDYYQVGNHVFGSLNVVDAFHEALLTWAKWIDANVNPSKSHVLFRGYSASHFRDQNSHVLGGAICHLSNYPVYFSGGQWNSGGACDHETEPIKNDAYLTAYPPKMKVLESVLEEMKTPVKYLNITRMTDYRKDAHPSVYRKKNVPEEERRSPLRFQDCSHWCLPGVPDLWNELLYAELLIKHNKNQQQLRQHEKQKQQQQQQQVKPQN
ncbi:hypothetical protein C5167_003731 [Papaver somniferum]|uniref:Uncharacterized protein n=1 Tax=Papaver somniferum TaxID=3469 RepID=A0A4Y7L4C4_PAPSO|nr:hypothetical protein C5167_003731 [Papaver somniferum]